VTDTSKKITLAYSPDTDDAFMVHAMQQELVDTSPYTFNYTSDDIQVLNDAAARGVYDVTAISIAAYPAIQSEYLLMPIGASIGDRFGPALITAPASPVTCPEDLAGKRVAVPGLRTSAYFAARALIGNFEAVPVYFKDIEAKVLAGEVDAGILIHELQLENLNTAFRRVSDLGSLWYRKFGLPLPLGANAIRRSLGEDAICRITAIMRESIEYGLAHRAETLSAALKSTGAPVDQDFGDRYISMYVNDHSLGHSDAVLQAMKIMFDAGAVSGMCPPCDLAVSVYS
jgi:1,4-dihydroxy-6-naphthoate synthase